MGPPGGGATAHVTASCTVGCGSQDLTFHTWVERRGRGCRVIGLRVVGGEGSDDYGPNLTIDDCSPSGFRQR
jgi:hypothetical protein